LVANSLQLIAISTALVILIPAMLHQVAFMSTLVATNACSLFLLYVMLLLATPPNVMEPLDFVIIPQLTVMTEMPARSTHAMLLLVCANTPEEFAMIIICALISIVTCSLVVNSFLTMLRTLMIITFVPLTLATPLRESSTLILPAIPTTPACKIFAIIRPDVTLNPLIAWPNQELHIFWEPATKPFVPMR